MERLLRARLPIREMFVEIRQKILDELEKEVKDHFIIQVKYVELEHVVVDLNELDQKILDLMLDGEEFEDEEYAAERRDIQQFETRWISIQLLVKSFTAPPRSPPPSEAGSSASAARRRTFRLPAIQLVKFDGNLKNWLGFWNQFEKIHTDDSLHESDKFQYLLNGMTPDTEPFHLINSYPQTAANYPAAVQALKERFGRDNLLLQVYIRELLNLVITNVTRNEKVSLATMYLQLESHLRALQSLNLAQADPSTWLYPPVESSLPDDTLRAWQRSPLSKPDGAQGNNPDGPPQSILDKLMSFLKTEVQSKQQIELARTGFQHINSNKPNEKKRNGNGSRNPKWSSIPSAAGLFAGSSNVCIFCEKAHESKECGVGQSMKLEEKEMKIKEKRACFRCLKTGHNAKKCKSYVKCMACKKMHFPIMCPDLHKPSDDSSEAPSATSVTSNLNCSDEIWLQTLLVVIRNKEEATTVRVLCDPGAQKSYIKKAVADELGLQSVGQTKLIHHLFGGSKEIKHHQKYRILVESEFGENRQTFEVLDQNIICGRIPRMPKGPWVKELREKNLWVPDVGHGSPEIQMLIGSDYYGHILTGNRQELENGLVALETIFGWTLSGRVREEDDLAMVATTSFHVRDAEISDLWDLELLGIRDPAEHKSKVEKEDEAKIDFQQTVTRSEDGRYCIKLPWIAQDPELPSNKSIAKSRLISATEKLIKRNQYDSYDGCFQSWLTEGIIETFDVNEDEPGSHYLIHHPVFKPDSLTTPVRPVFNASFKTKRYPSLNESLHKGPNLMELIPSVLLRFRENQIGVVSDIRKAFQMIDVEEGDRNILKFLWWEDREQKSLRGFRHRRVVFGVNCSPFLLAAVLEKHLTSVTEEEKPIADKLLKGLYVDNCVTSVNTMQEYLQFKEETTRILALAKMDLRQWECGGGKIGNVLTYTPEDKPISSVLGYIWDKSNDTLRCDIPNGGQLEKVTKRKILSATHQIFDPIGFTSPALIQPKLILQETWANEVQWDEEISMNLQNTFINWYEELQYLSRVAIPRCITAIKEDGQVRSVHVFCDASKHAYAAVVYLRTESENDVTVRFLQSKARIAPVKRAKGNKEERRISIPRLELLGCTIGARLSPSIIKSLELEDVPCHYWSDSTTALAWIQRNDIWGTFVGNRAREIVCLTDSTKWRHVPGNLNPADLPSRGCTPRQLLNSHWWEGPDWLFSPQDEWPAADYVVDENEVCKEKKKVTRSNAVTTTSIFTPKFSSYLSNVRVMAWMTRFTKNYLQINNPRVVSSNLTLAELRDAEKIIFRMVQNEAFPNGAEDIKSIKTIINDGLLCVQSRLTYKTDTAEFRSPIILPNKSEFVEQLIFHIHKSHCHAGAQFVLGKLREKYWILQGRRAVTRVLRNCTTCKVFTAKKVEVVPAPLPQKRVEITEAYQTIGVDLAGPLFPSTGGKAWIVLFTCAVYRAVHLDLVTSLSTEAFMGALERFININGRPNTIYSDNGTNFVGTANLFRQISWNDVEMESRIRQIEWIFNPPSAAWWGGWWERLVRSIKDLLKRMLGRAKINYDEMRTCLSAAEATINSRPLTTITEDSKDLIPLTPIMFTRGYHQHQFVESELVSSRELQGRYKKMQELKKDLQGRFRKEYLALLVQKAQEKNYKSLEVGDVVLVGADNRKRFDWPMGRVLELIPGRDGNVRVAKIKTSSGVLTRPLQRLYPLELSPQVVPVSPQIWKIAKRNEEQESTTSNSINEDGGDMPNGEDDGIIVTRSGRKVIPPKRYGQWNV